MRTKFTFLAFLTILSVFAKGIRAEAFADKVVIYKHHIETSAPPVFTNYVSRTILGNLLTKRANLLRPDLLNFVNEFLPQYISPWRGPFLTSSYMDNRNSQYLAPWRGSFLTSSYMDNRNSSVISVADNSYLVLTNLALSGNVRYYTLNENTFVAFRFEMETNHVFNGINIGVCIGAENYDRFFLNGASDFYNSYSPFDAMGTRVWGKLKLHTF